VLVNSAENEIVRTTLMKWKLEPRPVQLVFDFYIKQGFAKRLNVLQEWAIEKA